MKRAISVVALATCTLALGGCQTLFGTSSFASLTPDENSTSLDMSDYFASRFETGRLHLTHGRPTQAVIAFRQASYDPAYAGSAYNGMGVAYAQLGRQDLARRYFTMALAAEPQDERFARNLARLEQAPLDDGERAELAGVAPSSSQAPLPETRTIETTRPENPGLLRISSREVQISAAAVLRSDKTILTDRQQSARPAGPVAIARSERAQGYPVRIELPRAATPNTVGYPVRIAFSDVKVTRRADYPIRIELPHAN